MMRRELRNLLEVEAFEALEAGDLQKAALLADAVYAEKWKWFTAARLTADAFGARW